MPTPLHTPPWRMTSPLSPAFRSRWMLTTCSAPPGSTPILVHPAPPGSAKHLSNSLIPTTLPETATSNKTAPSESKAAPSAASASLARSPSASSLNRNTAPATNPPTVLDRSSSLSSVPNPESPGNSKLSFSVWNQTTAGNGPAREANRNTPAMNLAAAPSSPSASRPPTAATFTSTSTACIGGSTTLSSVPIQASPKAISKMPLVKNGKVKIQALPLTALPISITGTASALPSMKFPAPTFNATPLS